MSKKRTMQIDVIEEVKGTQFMQCKLYANAVAVASYVKGYLFDVLNDVGDDEYIAAYLREKGYEVKKQE